MFLMLITLLMVVITMIHFKKPFYFKTEHAEISKVVAVMIIVLLKTSYSISRYKFCSLILKRFTDLCSLQVQTMVLMLEVAARPLLHLVSYDN